MNPLTFPSCLTSSCRPGGVWLVSGITHFKELRLISTFSRLAFSGEIHFRWGACFKHAAGLGTKFCECFNFCRIELRRSPAGWVLGTKLVWQLRTPLSLGFVAWGEMFSLNALSRVVIYGVCFHRNTYFPFVSKDEATSSSLPRCDEGPWQWQGCDRSLAHPALALGSQLEKRTWARSSVCGDVMRHLQQLRAQAAPKMFFGFLAWNLCPHFPFFLENKYINTSKDWRLWNGFTFRFCWFKEPQKERHGKFKLRVMGS